MNQRNMFFCPGDARLQKNPVDIYHELRKQRISQYFISKVLVFYVCSISGRRSLRRS